MEFALTPRPDYSDYVSASPQYMLALKVVTGVFSGLSLFGALIVILFHVCCSGLWPNKIVRHIVVMLSIADLLVSISHIWGATQPLEKFLEAYNPNGSNFSSSDIQCTAQAVLAVVGTLSSFLWTLALVSYVCIVSSMQGGAAVWCQKPAVVALYSIPCWGFPILLTIVLARLYLLGYAKSVDLGWCYVSYSSGAQQNHNELLLGYELWTWIILGLIISFATGYIIVQSCRKYCSLCTGKSAANTPLSDQATNPVTDSKRLEGSESIKLTESVSDHGNINELTTNKGQQEASRDITQDSINFRPVLAGLLLIVLRFSSIIVDAALVNNHEKYYREAWIAYLTIFAAIGNSLQGLVNMFLFVWCTPQVYTKCRRPKCCKSSGYRSVG